MIPLSEWLKRGEKPKKKRKPMPKKTPRRAKADREYSVRRKRYLAEHMDCQAWDIILTWLADNDREAWAAAPDTIQRATEIHHLKKPKCKYLNDESTWLAVSFWAHRFIEDNKKTARLLGLLHY